MYIKRKKEKTSFTAGSKYPHCFNFIGVDLSVTGKRLNMYPAFGNLKKITQDYTNNIGILFKVHICLWSSYVRDLTSDYKVEEK